MKMITRFEGKILKRASRLSTRSKSTILIYAMGITPVKMAILKRKIRFISQLLNVNITHSMIMQDTTRTMKGIFKFIGFRKIITNNKECEKEIRQKCQDTIKKINELEKIIKESEVVKCIKYLMDNLSDNNHDTLQYILDPRNCEEDG